MGSFTKYPEIELLYRVPEILEEPEIIVTEKIHGTNVRLGWVEGRFRLGGRNEETDFEASASRTSFGFLGWIRDTSLVQKFEELAKSLGAEIIFYGEWFGPGVQRGVVYAKEKQLRIFDIRINNDLADWDQVTELTEHVGLKTVPLLYRGKPNKNVLDEKRSAPSVTAYENAVGSTENIGEGVVIKPSHMYRNLRNNWVIAKYKSPSFNERKSLFEGKLQPAIPASATAFVEEFFTLQRLEHILTNLRASDIDCTAPTAIGQVIRSMYEDVFKESKPEYHQLDEDSRKAVGKQHTKRTKVLLGIWLANQTEIAV